MKIGRFSSLFLYSIIAVPILVWCVVILAFSVNVPWFDDFDPFLDFLRKWLQTDDWINKLSLLFQPNNEHRMVFGKLANVLYFGITGQVNFTYLHIAGALFTLGTGWILFLSFRQTKLPLVYFLPIPFLLFQLQYHLIYLWAICSLQHQPVIFFVCLTMFLLAKNHFKGAIISALCANFAMSNGILVWVAGVVILILRSQWKQAAVWIGIGALAISAYFWGMSAQGNETGFSFLLHNPHWAPIGFFSFLGGLFDFIPDNPIRQRIILPSAMGMLVTLWVLFWLSALILPWLKTFFKKTVKTPMLLDKMGSTALSQPVITYFSLGVITFLTANAVIIAVLRTRFGLEVMVVSNYKLYPALFLSVAYLAFLSAFTRGKMLANGLKISVVLALMIWGASLIHYLPTVVERRKYLLVNAYNQEHNAFGLGFEPNSPAATYTQELMHTMTENGSYTYPSLYESYFNEMKLLKAAPPKDLAIEIQFENDHIFVSENHNSYSAGKDDGIYVFIRNNEKLLVYKLEQRQYLGRNFLKHFDKGSEVRIPKATIPEGQYVVGVFRMKGDARDGGIIRSLTISSLENK